MSKSIRSKQGAVEAFRRQWSDMKKDLGNDPKPYARTRYKARWCEEHFEEYGVIPENYCYLCEYVSLVRPGGNCSDVCPINWGEGMGCVDFKYSLKPIDQILSLPAK